MESELVPTAFEINGINLDNYFLDRRSYNSVVYIHKKFLPDSKTLKTPNEKKRAAKNKIKEKVKKNNHKKLDKSQQFNNEDINQRNVNYETLGTGVYNSSILEQTLRFAKGLVPLVISPAKNTSLTPVIYTIKTKKHKKHNGKLRESSIERDGTYNNEKVKKYKAVKKHKNVKESSSIKESIDPNSQNTLDDIHININQSCSFSESTEIKYHNKEPTHSRITNERVRQCFFSNSFEAFAAESLNGFDGSKIKIQLMDDLDKKHFGESLMNPIIGAIKGYLSKINNNKDVELEIKSLHKIVLENNQKLDIVIEQLGNLEKKDDINTSHFIKEDSYTKTRSPGKLSILEELGEDFREQTEKCIEEEDFDEDSETHKKKNRKGGRSTVVYLKNRDELKKDNLKEAFDCGEKVIDPVEANSNICQLGIKPDRPNRLPARFCWTEADKKK